MNISCPAIRAHLPLALVTRPLEDAAEIGGRLALCGYFPLYAPLLSPSYRKTEPIHGEAYQAVLVTSRHALRAAASFLDGAAKGLPCITVGQASAALARELGFGEVKADGGDAAAMEVHIKRALRPGGKPLLYLRGETIAHDLAGTLSAVGFTVEERQVYAMRPVEALPSECCQALAKGEVRVMVFFSRHTAATFIDLARKSGLPWEVFAQPAALAISENAALPLRRAGLANVRAALTPDVSGMATLAAEILAGTARP